MAQFTLSNFNRFILDTEDDANSPVNEELVPQIRENLEGLLLLLLDTGDGGAADSDPPDDNSGVLTDADPTNGAYVADEHNGRTLLITSGTAKGNIYTIDDTTTTTLVCTGDNLYSDGVRSGDTYKILYDCKVNLDGHDHDGVNSKIVPGLSLGQTILTGAWNMDTTSPKSVAHGLTLADIRSVDIQILNDAGTQIFPLNYNDLAGNHEGKWYLDATWVNMERRAGGMFDAATFDAATYMITILSVL